jgi:hypothetical protein
MRIAYVFAAGLIVLFGWIIRNRINRQQDPSAKLIVAMNGCLGGLLLTQNSPPSWDAQTIIGAFYLIAAIVGPLFSRSEEPDPSAFDLRK